MHCGCCSKKLPSSLLCSLRLSTVLPLSPTAIECNAAGSLILRGSVVDSGARRNGLSKADLDVFAKLAEQRLKWGEEAEALPGRQVVGEDDLLQLGVTECVEVKVARQVAP